MRKIAQGAFITIVVFIGLAWKAALLLPLLWPLFVVAAAPIGWYVLFYRHRESDIDAVIQQLETIRNAIADLKTAVPGPPRAQL